MADCYCFSNLDMEDPFQLCWKGLTFKFMILGLKMYASMY